tara:strand:- start:790 stop:2136 length:1347 start_codon:yes stop_codon:yes gene_type:complete
LNCNLGRSQTSQNNQEITRILFVFDASKSMFARWQTGEKIKVAQRLMTKMLDSLQSLDSRNFQIALRVYGHQKPVPPQDCNDTRLEVPFGDNNFARVKRVIRGLRPKGTTPIARSLLRSAHDFPECENCRNIIILITDGVESCDEDPCAASRFLQKKGITLKPFVIGIGLDVNFKNTFECVGNYFDAADEKTFQKVLGVVISQALNNTTAQISLLDANQNPIETDIPITLYNRTSGLVNKQFIHTLNNYGNPDTIFMDPLVSYDITVHSIPEVKKDSVRIAASAHNTIGIDVHRGSLDLRISASGRAKYDKLQMVIRKKNDKQILHVQDFNTSEKYLAGTYDIEILSLPRYIQEVIIDPFKTTTVSIPPPGILSLSSSSSGYGSIMMQEGNEWKWIYDLSSETNRQSIIIQPGNYRVVFRSKTSKNTEYSITKKFSINSGTTTTVKLN